MWECPVASAVGLTLGSNIKHTFNFSAEQQHVRSLRRVHAAFKMFDLEENLNDTVPAVNGS